MAQIDTSIYGRFAPTVKLQTPFEIEDGYQQIQQGQNQNKLSQMQFQEAERVGAERNALAGAYRDYYAQPTQDANILYKSLADAGQGSAIPGAMKSMNDAASSGVELGNKRLTGQKLQGEITQVQRERSAAKLGAHLNDPNLTADKILADLQSQVQSGELAPEQAEAMAQRIPQDPAQLKPFLSQILQSVMTPQQQVDGGNKNRNNLILPDGSVNEPLVGAKSRVAQAGAQQNYGSPVSGMQNGNPVFFQPSKGGGAPSIVPGITPPNANGKPMTGAQEAKYRDTIATDWNAANTNISNMKDILASVKSVREAPGLGGATGLQAYVKSWPGGEAARAEVKMKNLEGKVTQLGKMAAAQGGSVGPMAVQEWKIVRDMIAALEPEKGKDAYLEQVALIESQVTGAETRLRETYGKQYGADFEKYPQFANLNNGNAKPPAGNNANTKPSSLSAEKAAELAALRKRFGVNK